ncbi:MAG: nitroreductase family protein [Acidimicrobiales bacterium]
MTEFDLSHTDQLLMTTKQVRKRLDFERAVPRDVLLDCIDVASRAPMGSNVERNKWIIVEDRDLIAQIGELYLRNAAPYLAQNTAVRSTDRGARVVDSASYLAERMGEVPAMVIPIRLDRVEDQGVEHQAGWWGSVLPGVWSFQLALRSRGLGSCWTTLHLGYERESAEILGIPETVTQCCLLPVGYYTGDSFTPAPRRPAAEITFIDGWGNKAVDG